MIGKLTRIAMRELWKQEEDFTAWLGDNMDVLKDCIGIALSKVGTEQAAGSFRVDLVAEDDSDRLFVIENQFGKSDHDHLGKLLTYLTALEAKAAVWVVEDPRPEHVGVVTWLNESSASEFYLIKVEAVRIGASEPAPLLTLITGPSDETRVVVVEKQELAERHILRKQFWEKLLPEAKKRSKLFQNVSASRDHWISAGAGKSGIHFSYVILQHEARVEFVIDRPLADENRQILSALASKKHDIETAVGDELEWDAKEDRRACFIRKPLANGGYRDDQSRWPAIQDAMIDAMVRLENAVKPHLANVAA